MLTVSNFAAAIVTLAIAAIIYGVGFGHGELLERSRWENEEDKTESDE